MNRSRVRFRHTGSDDEISALARSALVVTSEGLPWDGVHVEAGSMESWEVDDLAPTDHYLAVNTGATPLVFEAKRGGRFERVVMPPGTSWFCPAGEPFSHRVDMPAGYTLVTIAPRRFERLAHRPVALRRAYAIERPPLTHLVQALLEDVKHGGLGGAAFADAVAGAAIEQLTAHFGASGPPVSVKGGLSPRALRRVLDLMEARLAEPLSVDELAAEAGLSPAHFRRAFKATVGCSPYQAFLRRRVERARGAILAGASSLSDVAARCGFSDQAHMTRLMKRQLGVTPGALAVRAR